METDLKPGQVVFFNVAERTDEFRHKRYSSIDRGRSVVLRGIVQDVRGGQFRAKLEGNNGFERDGEIYVFSTLHLLADQNFTRSEELGKWKEYDNSLYKKEADQPL